MSDKPLFQNTDEQEQVYAPQQIPNTNISAEETDAAGNREMIAGADGDATTVPLVAVRPDLSSNTPVMLPANSSDTKLTDDSSGSSRN